MTEAELAAIAARCEAAQDSPWTYTTSGQAPACVVDIRGALVVDCFSDEDAEFIAHARSDVPALLAEVKRLKGLVEAAYKEGWNEGVGDGHPLAKSPGSQKRWENSDAFDALGGTDDR